MYLIIKTGTWWVNKHDLHITILLFKICRNPSEGPSSPSRHNESIKIHVHTTKLIIDLITKTITSLRFPGYAYL